MSYMRGPCYVWPDDERVHIWAEGGYDGWDDSSWAEGRTRRHVPGSAQDSAASGVGVQQEIADAYVVMRLAELVCEQRIGAVVESAVANFGGNGGCLALQKLAASLISNLAPIGLDPAAAEMRNLWPSFGWSAPCNYFCSTSGASTAGAICRGPDSRAGVATPNDCTQPRVSAIFHECASKRFGWTSVERRGPSSGASVRRVR